MIVFEPGVYPDQLHAVASGSANTELTLTVAAAADQFWALDSFTFSASANPAAGTLLTITIGSTVVWKHYLVQGGPGPVDLGGLSRGVLNEAVTIVVDAAGAGVLVNLSLKYR